MAFKVKQPSNVYMRVNASKYTNIYVVGDVHGKLTQLNEQLEKVNFDKEQDLLISVGDIIDRGPDSLGCLALLKESWFTMVRGNHEDFAIASVTDTEDEDIFHNWLFNGGVWFLRVPPGDKRDAVITTLSEMSELPYVIEVKTENCVIVVSHACYPATNYVYGKEINTSEATWDRDRYYARTRGRLLTTLGADLFIHGHMHSEAIETYGNHVYIATGQIIGSELTLFKVQ